MKSNCAVCLAKNPAASTQGRLKGAGIGFVIAASFAGGGSLQFKYMYIKRAKKKGSRSLNCAPKLGRSK